MAKLNIASAAVPQDGRIKVKGDGREVDLRVSDVADAVRRERGHAPAGPVGRRLPISATSASISTC